MLEILLLELWFQCQSRLAGLRGDSSVEGPIPEQGEEITQGRTRVQNDPGLMVHPDAQQNQSSPTLKEPTLESDVTTSKCPLKVKVAVCRGISSSVVLNQRQFCLSWDNWQHLQAFLNVMTQGQILLTSSGQRCLFLGRKAMTNLDSILKSQRHQFANKGLYSQSYGFSSSHVWM